MRFTLSALFSEARKPVTTMSPSVLAARLGAAVGAPLWSVSASAAA
ncbi:hypothetical protein AB5I41_07205 [Sphingomonas sp. MMS24-JH45]